MRLFYLITLVTLISCNSSAKKSTESTTDKIIVYPSYARLQLTSEILGHAINKKSQARKSSNKTKKNKYLKEFAKKFEQFEVISKKKTIHYNADKRGHVVCDGKRECSLYHFSLGLACYEGDPIGVIKTLTQNFNGIGEELNITKVYEEKKRIYFTLVDKANGTKDSDYMINCE